jgi:hypothetical protein
MPASVPPVAEVPIAKLLRLNLQQRVADLKRRIAIQSAPRPRPCIPRPAASSCRTPGCRQSAVDYLMALVQWRLIQIESHEAREWLHVDGRIVFDPHDPVEPA